MPTECVWVNHDGQTKILMSMDVKEPSNDDLRPVERCIVLKTESFKMYPLDKFRCTSPLRLGAFIVAVIYALLSINGALQYCGIYRSHPSGDIATVNLVFAVIYMVAALLLFIGVLTDNKWIMTPWIFIMALLLITYVIAMSVYAIQVYNVYTGSGFPNLFMMFLNFMALLCYCWWLAATG